MYADKFVKFPIIQTVSETINNPIDFWSIIIDIFGILGFVIAAINAIYYFVHNRKKITLHISRYKYLKNYYEGLPWAHITFCVENKSQLPIAITRLILCVDGKKYNNDYYSREVFTEKRKINEEIISQHSHYSTMLPVTVPPMGALGIDLLFRLSPSVLSTPEKNLTFEVYTNRGKPFQTTLSLDADH